MKARQPITLEEVKKQTDDYLADFFTSKIKQASNLSSRYAKLWQSIASLVSSGGKRLRPYLLNLVFEAYGGEVASNKTLTASVAIELLHLSLLIHDDIIDDDYARHGQPNIAGRYLTEYSVSASEELSKHYANSTALLAGDLLLAEASRLIVNLDCEQINEIFYATVFEVASGELADIESKIITSELDRLEISRQKTASYSFSLPLLIGASLAGVGVTELEKIRLLANQLGIIYQLQDDLRDGDASGRFAGQEISRLTTASHNQINQLSIDPSFKSALKKLA